MVLVVFKRKSERAVEELQMISLSTFEFLSYTLGIDQNSQFLHMYLDYEKLLRLNVV